MQSYDTSHMASVRAGLENQGILNESANLICSSWRKSTSKSYELAWKHWSSWCSQQEADPLSTSIANIIQFLTEVFQEGKEYSTLNSYRSAISSSHTPIDDHAVGQHPTICHLLQGMFNTCSSKPQSEACTR